MSGFVDHALAARIEASQAAQLESFARVVAERLPQRGATFASIAGGRAAFLARRFDPSRAAGLGMHGPVELAEVEALERFYRERDTDARILVSPFADASLLAHLGERGFSLVDLETVLFRRILPGEPFAAPHPGVEVRQVGVADAALWVRTSLTGFTPPGGTPDFAHAPIYEASFHDPTLAFFTGALSGAVAGTAGVHILRATAFFFADSTLPAFRRHGVEGALIAARLAAARDAGCDLAFAVTAAGAVSQRNCQRAGFVPAYSQALLIKRFDGPQGATTEGDPA